MGDGKDDDNLVKFPFSKSGVSKSTTQARNLGLTKLSLEVRKDGKGAKGHWCKSCKGIWYTFFFEVECPVCGRRG
jgi:hypothetical protein